MNSEIYKYLLEQGFNDDEIDYMDEKNEMIWKTNLLNCKEVFEFLLNQNYSYQEIHDLLIKNPILISLSIEDVKKVLNIGY